jgi:ligand-binding sensor domain-containing protein
MPEGFARVAKIYEDRTGRLWFADRDDNVAVLDAAEKWKVYKLAEIFHHFDSDDLGINGICQDRSGRMLFATEIGLVVLEEATQSWSAFSDNNSDGLLGERVTCIAEDKRGAIWIAGGKGCLVLSPD